MTLNLVGITGNRGHGKDTLTRTLIGDVLPTYNLTGRRDGFADRLKISAARALGYIDEASERCIELMEAIKQENGGTVASFALTYSEDGANYHEGGSKNISGREFLQYYGTEAHRDVFGTDFWVDQVLPGTQNAFAKRVEREPWDVLLISDVRFPNEAKRVRKVGGKIIRITRPDLEVTDGHASEVRLPDELVDYELTNDDLSKLPQYALVAWRTLNKE